MQAPAAESPPRREGVGGVAGAMGSWKVVRRGARWVRRGNLRCAPVCSGCRMGAGAPVPGGARWRSAGSGEREQPSACPSAGCPPALVHPRLPAVPCGVRRRPMGQWKEARSGVRRGQQGSLWCAPTLGGGSGEVCSALRRPVGAVRSWKEMRSGAPKAPWRAVFAEKCTFFTEKFADSILVAIFAPQFNGGFI